MLGMQSKNSVNFGCSVTDTSEETQPIILSHWKRLFFHHVEVLLLVECTNEIRVWDATNYELLMAILLPHECRQPFALTFSSCGRYFASGSWWYAGEKAPIELWKVDTGENIPTLKKFATLPGHPTDVQCLAFSPDGTLLASASFDGTILLWDMTPYRTSNAC